MIKFIIDTDSYSGNFEREMCAYATAHLRDCGVGNKLVEETIRQKFAFHIQKIKDERGCMTPVDIAPTPGFGNNGLGFNGDGSTDSFKKAKEAYITYVKSNELAQAIKRVKFYEGTKADNSGNIAELKRIEAEVKVLEERPETEFLPYPAYQSVCIYFKTLPKELIDILKERTQKYAEDKKIKILNYRIIDTATEQSEEISKEETSDSIKVKLSAYDGCIIIKVMDSEKSDKDFLPNTGSRIGCSLSNLQRLGISEEALELLKEVRKNGDVIGDFMWDDTSFGWCGGTLAIKEVRVSEAARGFRMSNKFISIPNEVAEEEINLIKEMKEVKNIDYNDIQHEVWFNIQRRDENSNFRVDMQKIPKYIHDGRVTIMNAPEGLVSPSEYGAGSKIKMTKETYDKVQEFAHKVFTREMILENEKYMDKINRFYEIGAFNNVMHPCYTSYRMTISGTQKEILEKLNSF